MASQGVLNQAVALTSLIREAHRRFPPRASRRIVKVNRMDLDEAANLAMSYRQMCMAIARRILGDRWGYLAEDVFMQSVLAFVQAAGSVDAQRNPRSFFCTICRNKAIDEVRRLGGKNTESLDDGEHVQKIPAPPDPSIETKILLETALETLSSVERHVLVQKRIIGRTLEEIFDDKPVHDEWKLDPDRPKVPEKGQKQNFVKKILDWAEETLLLDLAAKGFYGFGNTLVVPSEQEFEVTGNRVSPSKPQEFLLLPRPGARYWIAPGFIPRSNWLIITEPRNGRNGRLYFTVTIDLKHSA